MTGDDFDDDEFSEILAKAAANAKELDTLMKKIIGSRRGSRPVKGAPALPPPAAPPPGGDGTPVAPTGDFFTTASVASEWMLAFDGAAGSEVRQIKGTPAVVGSVATGATFAGMPALDTGESNLSRAFGGAARARATGLATPANGIGILFQARPTLSSQILVGRRNSFAVAGGVGISYNAAGKVEVYMASAESTYVYLASADGAIVAGDTYLVVPTYGAAGAKLYVTKLGAADPGTPVDTDASTAVIAGAFDVDIGGNFNDSARFNGAIGYVWGYTTQPADAHVTALAALIKARVRWVPPVTFTLAPGATQDISPMADALQGGAMTLQASTQPATATLATAAGPVLRASNVTASSDNSDGRYTGTENAIVSAPAVVRVIGTAAPPPGGGDPGVSGTLRGLNPSNANSFWVGVELGRGFSAPTSLAAPPTSAAMFYGLRSIQNFTSPFVYAPPGQMTTFTSFTPISQDRGYTFRYDHSEAGLNSGARKAADRYIQQYGAAPNGAKPLSMMMNFENFLSANVPQLVDGTFYNLVNDTTRVAAVDDLNSRRGLRVENQRFRSEIIKRTKALLLPSYPWIEIIDYNMFRRLNEGDWSILPSSSKIQIEVNEFQPFFNAADAHGPQAGQLILSGANNEKLFNGTGPESYNITNTLTAYINMAKVRELAFAANGQTARNCPLIWPRAWTYGSSHPWSGQDYALRPGWMTLLLDGLWNAGVRRFLFWYWWYSGVNLVSNAEYAAAHASLEEAAAWITAKGTSNIVVRRG